MQSSEMELKTLKARKASLQRQLELIEINTISLTSENIQSIINITSPISESNQQYNGKHWRLC